MAWSAVSRLVIQVVQLGTTSVLARIITPSQFGLVALVSVFIGFAYIFSDLGVGAAVVHRAKPDDRFLSTAFWLNTLAGFVLTAFMCAVAPLIALFFHQRALVSLVIVASGSFAFAMFAVHSALLQKQLRFKTVGLIETSAVLVYAASAISFGLAGLGALALVLGSLIQTAATTAMFWFALRWRPTSFLDRGAMRDIWSFAGGLLGFNVVNYWTRNLDNLAIGRFSGPVELAFYSRAYNLMLLPVGQMNVVVGRVLFPVLTMVRDDRTRLREAYVRVVTIVVVLACPVSVLLATAAPAVISLLYGSRWAETASLLSVLAVAGPPQLIAVTCGPLYQTLGLTGRQFRRSLWSAAGTAVAVLAGLPWGAFGVAVALAVRFYVLLPVVTTGAWRKISLTLVDVLVAVRTPLLATAAMVAACLALRFGGLTNPPILALGAQAVAGLGVYFMVVKLVEPSLIFAVRSALPRRSR